MKKFIFLCLLILEIQLVTFAEIQEQSIRVYSYPPKGIESVKNRVPLLSLMKKYFYLLSCTVTNNSTETLHISISKTGLTSTEVLDLFLKYEEQRQNKNELKENIDGLKEYGSAIGSVPLAELATAVYIGSLPYSFVKTVFKKKKMSKRDVELFAGEYEMIKKFESERVTNAVLVPGQEIRIYGVYVLGSYCSPIVEINYSSGKKYTFKL